MSEGELGRVGGPLRSEVNGVGLEDGFQSGVGREGDGQAGRVSVIEIASVLLADLLTESVKH